MSQKQLSISNLMYEYAEHQHKNPTLRNRFGLIHVSDVVKGPGWECDRYLEYIRTCEERINPEDPFHSGLYPTFWVGSGIEKVLDVVLEDVVKTMLPAKGLELVSFETQVSFKDEKYGILGNADYLLTYKDEDGVVRKHVIDAKSTSSSQDNRRNVKTKGKGFYESNADADHIRQVAVYQHYLGAEYGSLLYVTKTYPHRLSDGVVSSDRVVRRIHSRLDSLEEGFKEGRRAVPTRGPHCSECRWSQHCEEDR